MRWSRNSSDAASAASSGRLPSLVWLIPLAAALICAALAYQSVSRRGPAITIRFLNAEGLEAGKAAVKYRDVEIGTVEAITLASDRSHVVLKYG
ncbi:paraquat-inducible protein B [Paraburkholderia bryophila]|uniref:Paraquat-inducible protein B n=1 Tax=Paraburkholderia bryophila TaxID=420952 RepID=A0A7Y9W8X3_9BURK|nr:paraquat-inducible protein B [Paraburkholderia bryophila]